MTGNAPGAPPGGGEPRGKATEDALLSACNALQGHSAQQCPSASVRFYRKKHDALVAELKHAYVTG